MSGPAGSFRNAAEPEPFVLRSATFRQPWGDRPEARSTLHNAGVVPRMPRPHQPNVPMTFNRSLRHHSLRASDVLPLYDGVFTVAFTLLAFNLPDRLAPLIGTGRLLQSVGVYGLVGIAVIIYWFKLRRLMLIDRLLQPPQLLLVALGLLSVVLVPKLANLVLRHGVGAGNVLHWTLPQLVNTLCLGVLLLFNLICVLYTQTLRQRRGHRGRVEPLLNALLRNQALGMLALLVLMALELSFHWFDNQYLYLLPVILLAEEIVAARKVLSL